MANDLALLGEVLRDYGGPLKDLAVKLSKDPRKWGPALNLFLRGQNPWPEKVSSKPTEKRLALLKPLKTVVELPKPDIFRAVDHLRFTPNDERETAELVIGFLGDNIENAFFQQRR